LIKKKNQSSDVYPNL